MSIGETRGTKRAKYIVTGGAVPDVAADIEALRLKYDLPPSFWESLIRHLQDKFTVGLVQRVQGDFERQIEAVENSAKEFMAAFTALNKTKAGKRMAQMAGRDVIENPEFYRAMKAFQNLQERQAFEGYPAGYFRQTILEISTMKPEWQATEITRFCEALEAIFPKQIFPPDREPTARRDYVKNCLKTIG
ncbi:hypothetical protein [Roseinatronobacter bogoriensis]|uniref:Uncharacterized protein n=1 Tax=Roseinatronobacter bogoriensis subsp. barguzinensis TaxID=441209 RepID=A0A2K8KHC9_9RHOB|nr:hypothetical protein [Rhodobaca]ATX66238.1 hypothetical protein BG454_10790 [Rhodobaca barguzinensis]MBB4207355.1 hypothetical protein [Rhodobaca bogoriensis DSM 18756]TDW40339.1 hypothetical protein LY39_01374 [Rhodobaca barguzinensis]TDY70509.1 hypothetical protein EV660_102183 [Rhodobaca bogoriensis DSM 18756]